MGGRILKELLVVLLCYALLAPPVAMPLYNRILFFPDTNDYEARLSSGLKQMYSRGVSKRDIFFSSSDGSELHGWLFRVPGARHVALVSHGNGGNIANRFAIVEALVDCNCSVFLYDYRGYGKSTGQPSIEGVCDDACSAFDYLTESEHIKARDIVVYGESIGTGVTCELVKRRKAGAMILQSGFPSLAYVAHDRLWFTWLYPESWLPQFDCLGTVKKEQLPLLVVHGTEDPDFPIDYAKLVFNSAITAKKHLLLVDGMGHSLIDPTTAKFHDSVLDLQHDMDGGSR